MSTEPTASDTMLSLIAQIQSGWCLSRRQQQSLVEEAEAYQCRLVLNPAAFVSLAPMAQMMLASAAFDGKLSRYLLKAVALAPRLVKANEEMPVERLKEMAKIVIAAADNEED